MIREGAASARQGKHLTFVLGDELYGTEILKVQEIIGIMKVTEVPRTPDYIRGVINLRGKVIPVLELRRKFGMAPADDTERTCVVVVQVANTETEITMGVIVDEVSEVLDLRAEQLEPPPAFGHGVETDFILGMAKVDARVIMILDVDRVLSTGDLETVGRLANGE